MFADPALTNLQRSDGLTSPGPDELARWEELRSRGLAPAAVTALLTRAAAGAAGLGDAVVRWVESQQNDFRPDLVGLFAVYRSVASQVLADLSGGGARQVSAFLERDQQSRPERGLCWQIAWVLSRGGLRGLLDGLAPTLASSNEDDLVAAAFVVADVADYEPVNSAPLMGRVIAGPPVRMDAGLFDVEIDIVETMTNLSYKEYLAAPCAPVPAPTDDDVQFTVYRPAAVRPAQWYPLLAFAHRTELVEHPAGGVLDPLAAVRQQARLLLQGQPVSYHPVSSDSGGSLPRGSELTFAPWLQGGEINPERISLRWEEPVHRAEFRVRAPAEMQGTRLRGGLRGLRVYLGVVLIGEVDFRVGVDAATPDRSPPEPTPVRRYRKIFASYSHHDTEIVRRLAAYVSTIGDRYLIDVQALRSGERWSPRLVELIEQADVFQLFWSHNSMGSAYVRSEWEYALGLGRDGFIRPVYWEDPLPADVARGLPPAALGRFHFARLIAEAGAVDGRVPVAAARGSAPPLLSAPSVSPHDRPLPRAPMPPRVGSAPREWPVPGGPTAAPSPRWSRTTPRVLVTLAVVAALVFVLAVLLTG